MLNQAELTQVREYVIKVLPELLRTEPTIATTIEGMLAELFPRRDEFARLLDEVQRFRAETTGHLGQVDARFTQVDARFDRVDARFDQVDARLDRVDARFDQVDARFDQVDRTILGVKRDIAQLKSGQQSILKRMDGMEAWMQLVTGIVRNEKGTALEDIVAAALRYKLKNLDVAPENVYLRRKLVDHEGTSFAKGFETEVDVVAENGDLRVFEVKSTGQAKDVGLFALKVNLVRAQNPEKRVRGLFIAPIAMPEIRKQCEKYGVEVLT